jgi:hypothetical protein
MNVIGELRQRARREAELQSAPASRQEDAPFDPPVLNDAREVDEAAFAKPRPQRQNKPRRASRRAVQVPSIGVVRHRLFVPVVTIWAAAVCGLSVMMLSSVTIARVSMFAGIGALGDLAQLVFASAAAMAGALAGWCGALLVRRLFRGRRVDDPGVARMIGRRVRPIDPVHELGSASLDAPLETMPFAVPTFDEEIGEGDSEANEEGLEDDTPQDLSPQDEEMHAPEGEDETFELDLGAFGEILEEEETGAAHEREFAEAAPDLAKPGIEAEPECAPQPQPMLTGIAKLRATPPQELSLVQLVERFAAALHEVQDRPQPVAGIVGDPPREQALAEALKALSMFAPDGLRTEGEAPAFDPAASGLGETERELREALSRLNTMRGAA